MVKISTQNVASIFLRHFLVWQRHLAGFVFMYMLDPLVFLFSIGIGLGLAYESIGGLSYWHYIVPGMMCASILWPAVIDGTYQTYTQFSEQKLYDAMLATPVKLSEILLAGQAFSATRAMVASILVLVVGYFAGGVSSFGAGLIVLPVLWVCGMAITAMANVYASQATNHGSFDYIWPIFVSPMYLAGGIFIDPTAFPEIVQKAVLIYPLPHAVIVVRGVMTGAADVNYVLHIGFLIVLWAVFYALSVHLFKKRFLD